MPVTIKSHILALASIALIVCIISHQQVDGAKLAKSEPASSSEPLVLFPMPIECSGFGEHLVEGQLPECEPTCKNFNPTCKKILLMDSAACFCKQPLVRHDKKCIERSACPGKLH